MKKTSFLLYFLFLSSVQLLSAQHLGNSVGVNSRAHTQAYQPSSPIINFKVDVLLNAKASTYTAVFNLSQVGATSEEANALIDTRINKVKSGMMAMGLPRESIHIDMISFVPVYEIEVEKKLFSKTYNEVPKGFEIQKNIHVDFIKNETFDALLRLCAENEIYNLVKVDYFVEDMEKIYAELQTKALAVLASKKEFYTSIGIDFEAYEMLFSESRAAVTPHESYSNYQAFNSISVDAVRQKKGLTKVKKSTSVYYNPISYKRFDVVINPVINEPVVQFTLSLNLQYSPKPKEPTVKEIIKTNTQYYMITRDGNFKQLQMEENK